MPSKLQPVILWGGFFVLALSKGLVPGILYFAVCLLVLTLWNMWKIRTVQHVSMFWKYKKDKWHKSWQNKNRQ